LCYIYDCSTVKAFFKMANFRIFLGRNIPMDRIYNTIKALAQQDITFEPTLVQLSISIKELERFLRTLDFVEGFTMIHCSGLYKNNSGILEEEESTQLDIFGITKLQAIQIASCYKSTYFQERVLFIRLPDKVQGV
jgi:hypothetical protein